MCEVPYAICAVSEHKCVARGATTNVLDTWGKTQRGRHMRGAMARWPVSQHKCVARRAVTNVLDLGKGVKIPFCSVLVSCGRYQRGHGDCCAPLIISASTNSRCLTNRSCDVGSRVDVRNGLLSGQDTSLAVQTAKEKSQKVHRRTWMRCIHFCKLSGKRTTRHAQWAHTFTTWMRDGDLQGRAQLSRGLQEGHAG